MWLGLLLFGCNLFQIRVRDLGLSLLFGEGEPVYS